MNPPQLLFFQSNFAAALGAYERALVVSEQREVRLLCLHEVGWSQLLLLRWELASRSFLRLKSDSRWSKSFYSYLSAGGSSGFYVQSCQILWKVFGMRTGHTKKIKFCFSPPNIDQMNLAIQ